MENSELKNNKIILRILLLSLIVIVFLIYIAKSYNLIHKIGDLNYGRAAHTATLLNNGQVLIVGGAFSQYNGQKGIKETGFEKYDKVEIYLPNVNKFEIITQLNENRVAHTATLLKDGNVLIVGGIGSTGEKIYDVKNNRFIPVGNLNIKRYAHSAILLDDGSVLIAGGGTQGVGAAKEIEIFNPNTNKFKIVGKIELKNSCSVTLKTVNLNKLSDGRILITPIVNEPIMKGTKKNTDYVYSLIYDYKKNSMTTLSNFGEKCYYNKTFITEKDNIYNICSENFKKTVIEKYNLKNHSIIVLSSLIQPRYDYLATMGNDNTILIFGGRRGIPLDTFPLTSVEKYDIKNNRIMKITNYWTYRNNFTITKLKNGGILLTGGITKDNKRTKLAEKY